MKARIALLILGFLALSCQKTQVKNDTSSSPNVGIGQQVPPKETFSGNMQELQQTLTHLLPIVADGESFEKPEAQAIVRKDIKKLVALSKNINHGPSSSAAAKDPSVNFISDAFSEDLERIDESLALGKKEYARNSIMSVTSYCIECHTRTSTGPSFQSSALDQALKKMDGLEKAEFLLATRQFEPALKEVSKFIDERLAQKNDFFGLDKAIKYALSITVKYLKDSKRSLELVSKIRNASGVPYYLKQNAIGWETAIKDWSKEKTPKDFSTEAMLNRVRNWMVQAQKLQVGFVDRGGDIYYLRALSDLHLILQMKLTPEQMGEAFYMAGLGYEAVRDLSMFPLHEKYYESCIRKVPNSTWSLKCFKRYEESIYFGYTGSSGTHLPPEVVQHLQTLRTLAFPPGLTE